MDDELKDLMKELGYAINESLSESERISAVIEEIKEAGYDVFLVLEATIGFNKCESGSVEAEQEADGRPASSKHEFQAAGKIKWTSQDQKFLRALKIAVDEERGI